MSAVELLEEVTELVEIPDNPTEIQLIECYMKAYDTVGAELTGLEERIKELSNRVAAKKMRKEKIREQIDAGMSTLQWDKYQLPGVGTFYYTNRKPSLSIEDDEAAIKWAEKHAPELVTHVPKLDKAAYKKVADDLLKVTGELLPGAKYEHEKRTLTIRGAK